MIHSGYHGEIGMTHINKSKKNCVRNPGDPLRHLLVLLYPVIKVNRKLQQSIRGRITKGTYLSGKNVWVAFPVKDPRPDEELIESRINTKWVVEECTSEDTWSCIMIFNAI